MSQPIQSEAHLTTFEAISMIVGNSIGTGINTMVPAYIILTLAWTIDKRKRRKKKK